MKFLPKHLQPFFISIVASSIAGASVALLNLIIELIRGNSVFLAKDIFIITVWHIFIFNYFGIIIAFILFIIITFIKKTMSINYALIYFYIFVGCWILVVSYVNQNFLPLLFSKESLLWNTLLFIEGKFVTFLLIRFELITKLKRIQIQIKL